MSSPFKRHKVLLLPAEQLRDFSFQPLLTKLHNWRPFWQMLPNSYQCSHWGETACHGCCGDQAVPVEKVWNIRHHSLHFMVPWVFSVQASKLQRWQTDFCLTGWLAGRKGGKDNRSPLEELIPQVSVYSMGYIHNLPQGPKPICEVNPQEKSPNTSTFTSTTNKGSKKNIHCTLHIHLCFPWP